MGSTNELRSTRIQFISHDARRKSGGVFVDLGRSQIIVPMTVIDSTATGKPLKMRYKIKIDTGAIDVVLPSDMILGKSITENAYRKEFKREPHERYGIAKDTPVMYYTHIVDSISLGGFKLYKFPVEISFEERARAKLLGMSLLGLFNIVINNRDRFVELVETPEVAPFINSGKPLLNPNELCRQDIIDFGETASKEELEANYIHRRIIDK